MSQPLLTLTLFAFLAVTLPSLAQSEVPQPDQDGNYFSNQTAVTGQAASPLSTGSLWRVTSVGLNCRSGAGADDAIVRQFKQGELLQADVGRGGSDEVLWNATDSNGNPWMRVRSSDGESYDCYVRANRRYIQPYTGAQN